MSSISEPSEITGLPDPHDATHAVGIPAHAALDLEAFLFQNAGEVFRRLEFLKPEFAETEDAIHHHLRLFLHAVDLAGEVGLDGGFFLRREFGLRESAERAGQRHNREFLHR